jgi:hypothetical protein
VLARSPVLGRVLDDLREAITTIESANDVTIELKALTRADLAIAQPTELGKLADALPLYGAPPITFTKLGKEQRSLRNILAHSDLDHQQWLLAREIAQRLVDEPAKVDAAREYIKKRLDNASPGESHELKEWDAILRSMSINRLQKFLLDTGERATRLRQSMPFLFVLSPGEREELLSKVQST